MSTLLDFQIIREDTVVTVPPTVEKLDSFKFTPTEERILALQLINLYNKKPYVLPSGWEATIEMQTADPEAPLVRSATINDPDRSILTIELDEIDTQTVITGRLKITIFEIADPTNKMIATKSGIFIKTKEKCEC